MATPQKRFRVPEEVAQLVRGLHPDIKKKVRAALDRLAQDIEAGKALQGDLKGLGSLRVARFRVISRASARRVIEIVAIGPRDRVYEETLRLVSAGRRR
ncbi:MAG: type II toxin-antitoxin system RelE/ParE family toxin [Betaproteobacteria bacterium]|nr:type II toxin-antitoxin system RelE/ParE family toxin [Betaproteobacteria bacterium]